MHDALLAAYRATAYRVRLAGGGWCAIRIDQPLPAALAHLAGDGAWGFITAWNPDSQPTPRADNRHAQRRLAAALRALPGVRAVHAGQGVSADGGWREASLWVIGAGTAELDPIARQFGQHGYVHGVAAGPARLRLLPPPAGA